MAETKIITLNVNGLRGIDGTVPKRRKIFSWLRQNHADICFLQETHSDIQTENIWSREWGGSSFWAHGETNARGVGILFRPGLNLDVWRVQRDSGGRFIVLGVTLSGTKVKLACVYGPNTDDGTVFEKLFEACEELDTELTVIAGDFNFIFDYKLDRESSAKRLSNNHRCKRLVEQYMQTYDLVDIWRENNPEKRRYTYYRSRPSCKSRIDFFLISAGLKTNVRSSNIKDGYLSDHKMCTLQVRVSKTNIGRSYWKFQDILLTDSDFESQARRKIIEIIELNDTPDLSRTILLQTVLCVMRGWIIQYQSEKKKAKEKQIDEIETRINLEMNKTQIDAALVEQLKSERDELIEAYAKRSMFHGRSNWRQFSEKGTKYFHGLVKRNTKKDIFKSMRLELTDNSRVTENSQEMADEGAEFFERLYAKRKADAEGRTRFNDITQLSNEQMRLCEGPISERELNSALASMNKSSSPGPDGYTAIFFRYFWTELRPLIVVAMAEVYQNGQLPLDLNASITTLIHKKGKARDKIDCLRPISLLNVLYKLMTKVLSMRLNKVLAAIINRDQNGFIKGRYIGENVRLILDILTRTKNEDIGGLLLLCDWSKAYDSIDWSYMHEIIRSYGFGEQFRKWINILYPLQTSARCYARVQINGILSRKYQLNRGLRQGCSLSSGLFLLCAEPLAEKIRRNALIHGLKFCNTEVKLAAYADDFAIVMDGSEESLRECLTCCEDFRSISGLQLNRQKTKALWIGKYRNRDDIICPEAQLSWDKGPVEYLGIKIHSNTDNIKEINYPEKIKKLKDKLQPWFGIQMTVYGRVHVIKSEALSQLIYLMSVLPKPSPQQLKEIESIVFRFIWGKKRDKIKRSVLKNEWIKGGLKVPDPALQADSLKCTWVKKFIDDENDGKWKEVAYNSVMLTENISIFQCDTSYEQALQWTKNEFWAEAAKAWADVARLDKPSGKELLSTVLWCNRYLNLERNQNINRGAMKQRGVNQLKDLYDFEKRRLFTSSQLKDKYSCGNFLTWESVKRKIPIGWKDIVAKEKPEESTLNKNLEAISHKVKVPRWAYSKLLKEHPNVGIPEQAQRKWERDLNTELDWSEAFKTIYQITTDPKLRWLQYRTLTRILTTNRRLQMYGIKNDDHCEKCPGVSENISHLFWNCQYVQSFWMSLAEKLSIIEPLSLASVISGIYPFHRTRRDIPVQLCILLAKQFIWICKYTRRPMNVDNFLTFTKNYINVEKYVAINEEQVEKFEEKWKIVADRLGIG